MQKYKIILCYFAHKLFLIMKPHTAHRIPLLREPFVNKGLRYKVFLMLCCFSACNQNTFYHKTDTLPNETWNMNHILDYKVNITDSLQYYSFFIDIRNTTDYSNQNLWVFFTTQSPDNNVFTDTLNCIISDAYGRWTGKGSGRIRDNRLVFKSKVRFPRTGTYIFSAQQAMRTNDLKGIADFGITLLYE